MILISIKELIPPSSIIIYHKYGIKYLILIPILAYIIILLSNKITKNNNNLYRVGILSFITLFIHNIPEGIATFISSGNTLGIKLMLAIMAHNIPEGICISIPIYYATKKRNKALLYTFIGGIAEPIGGLIFYLLFKNYINNYILNILLYFIGSLMIIISFKEILPEILRNKNKYWFLYGLLLSLFILLI